MNARHDTPSIAAAKAATASVLELADAMAELTAEVTRDMPRCACGALAELHSARCLSCQCRRSVARAAINRLEGQALSACARLGDADAAAELHVLEEQERERDERQRLDADEPGYDVEQAIDEMTEQRIAREEGAA